MKDQDKSRRVREMFGAIAGRYDFLNRFQSANIDRRWRKGCVSEMRKRIQASPPRILDVGCGTADFSLAFAGLGPWQAATFANLCWASARKKSPKARIHPLLCWVRMR